MAVLAHGAVLRMGDGGTPTEVFTAITNAVLDIEFDPGETERVDVTNHDSTAREYISGLAGEGSLTTEIQYDGSNTVHQDIRDKHGVEQPTNWELVLKDGTLIEFAADVVVKWSLAVASGEQKMPLTLRVSGEPTYTDP